MENSKISLYQKFDISLNSLGFFLLSYLFVYFVHQLITCCAATAFHIPTLFQYNDLRFYADSSSWNFSSVKTVFLAGPIVSLLLAISFLMIEFRFQNENGLLRLFFLWGAIHAFNLFFGAMVVGALTGNGIGYALNWMYVMDTGKLVIVMLASSCLIVIGALLTRMFLFTANSYFSELRNNQKQGYLRAILFYPYLTGSLLLYLLKSPVNTTDLFLQATLLLMIFPIFMHQSHFTYLNFYDETPHTIKINRNLMISSMIVVVVFRLTLSRGIYFG